MNTHDEQRLELLMTRRLDGEASAAESEELDRLLAEDAEARSMFEEYARIEVLAGEVIREAVGCGAPQTSEAIGGIPLTGSRRITLSKWWTLPAAMAACLAAVMIVPQESGTGVGPTDRIATPIPWPGGENDTPMIGSVGINIPISHAAPKPSVVNRQRDRELIGVMTDDDSLYLLDVRRTVTLETPRNKDNIVLIGDPL
jgi:hypothetical protein